MANSSGGNGGKNPLAQLGTFKGKAIVALVLVAVLLVVSIAGSIASLIGMLMASQDDGGETYTQTLLHVRASNLDLNTGKYVPVPNLEISLVQKKPPKDKDGKKMDPQQIGFPSTDEKGEAETVLNTGGNGAFTYTDGISLDPEGRPTDYIDIVKGKGYHTTMYDNSSVSTGSQGSDTGQSDYSYNLDSDKPAGINMCGGTIHPTKEPNSPSDTWHIVGVTKSNKEALQKLFFNGSKDGQKAYYGDGYGYYGSYLFVFNEQNPSCSYGTAVAADVGGGADSRTIGDLWMPAYKYYGIKGLKGTGAETATVRRGKKNAWVQYLASKGISYPKDMNNPPSTIYVLDHGQKGSRGYQLLHAMQKNQRWIFGGGSASLGNDKDNDKYVINFKGEHGNDLIRTPMELSKVYTDETSPYIVHEVSVRAVFRGEMKFEFWTTTETIGGDSAVTGSIANPPNLKNKGYSHPPNPFELYQCTWYCWGRIYETTGKAPQFTVNNNRNGCYWYQKLKGEKLGQNPRPGSIMCLKDNNSEKDGNPGHVAFVESVADGGSSITISEGGNSYWRKGNRPNVQTIKRKNGTYPYKGKTCQGFVMPS